MNEYGQAGWTWRDIQTVKPEWGQDECEVWLEAHADKLIDVMTAEGWNYIHEKINE